MPCGTAARRWGLSISRLQLDQVYSRVIALADERKIITDEDLTTVIAQVRTAAGAVAANATAKRLFGGPVTRRRLQATVPHRCCSVRLVWRSRRLLGSLVQRDGIRLPGATYPDVVALYNSQQPARLSSRWTRSFAI